MSAAKQDFKMIIYIKKIMRLDTKQTWLFDWSYILDIKNIYFFIIIVQENNFFTENKI